MRKYKWKTILGLILIVAAAYFNYNWIWSGFFLFWAILDLKNGETYFLEQVTKRSNPVIYWIVIFVWLAFAVMSFIPDSWWYKL